MPAYKEVSQALGREMLPPFTIEAMAVALTALGDGMQMRRAVDPAAVRDGLYADLVSAVVIALTRPVTERSELAALEATLDGSPAAPPDQGEGRGRPRATSPTRPRRCSPSAGWPRSRCPRSPRRPA